MYSFTERVRYTELDENRNLALTSIINYMQDCCIYEAEDRGVGIDWLLEATRDEKTFPLVKDELIDYAQRTGAPMEVIENLMEIEDEGDPYDSIEDLWPDYPTKDDFFFQEDEY